MSITKWQKDNEYIVTGYRSPSDSWLKSIWSIFSLHNETVNIHSHLFGGLLFCLLPLYTFREVYVQQPNAGPVDVLVFMVFFYGVAVCFLLSATFHIFANHSPGVAAFGNQLDYLGVVLLMWGATIPTVYYGFYDDPRLQSLYSTVVSVLAVICSVATFHSRFRTPTFRPYRAMIYAALGLSAVCFVFHGVIIHGWEEQNRRMSLNWMILMASLNIFGAVLYASRIPEKLYPGVFDTFGSSHQILHFMVILAGLAHMMGLVKAFNYIHSVLEPRSKQ